tara:strand:+ start:14 stop:1024 length:1011 start_codon:yes stop_codon:yes gene_type:complete
MELILSLSILIAFISTALILPSWIKKCKKVGILWEDMNKFNHPKKIVSSGGIAVIISFILGVFFYIAIRTFIIGENGGNLHIFALLSIILILAIIGLTDDFLGWENGGLSARFRLFFIFMSSIPLVIINAGTHSATLPFLGYINLGLIYPLLIIPIGVAGATAAYNFLAGFNGLEAGQGIIILSFLSFIAYITGSAWISLIGLIMVAALVVFYIYNKYPARVFPGDILTYSIGALIAIMAILGDFEKIAVFIFSLYILEVILKLRGRLKKQSFAKPNKDGSLEMPYSKIYGVTHLSLFILKKFKNKVYEKDVVYLIFIFQILICLSSLIIFREFLF